MILRNAPKLVCHPVKCCNALNTARRRQLSSTASSMVAAKDISPSANEDREVLVRQTTDLVENGQWRLCNEGKGLERVFKFKTFKATWDFMNTIAAECKTQKHHPEWMNIYNRTFVRWTTHNPEGLSSKDVGMARFCDEVAREKGEVDAKDGEEEMEWMKEGRECCGGRK